MFRFCGLIKNEFVKMFSHKSTIVMLIIIPIITFGLAFIIKYSTENDYYYNGQPREKALEQYIENLNRELATDSNDSSRLGMSKNKQRAGNFKSDVMTGADNIEAIKIAVDELKNVRDNLKYDIQSWKMGAVMDQISLLSEAISLNDEQGKSKLKAAAITIGDAAKNDDFTSYVNTMVDIANYHISISENENEKLDYEDEKLVWELRLKNDVKPQCQIIYQSQIDNWREDEINAISAAQRGLRSSITEKEIQGYKDKIAISTYRIENNQKPIEGKSMYGFMMTSSILVSLISLFAIVIGATLMASEYTSGTIKLLLISPYKRWKIFSAKLVSIFLMAIIMLGLLFFSSMVSGGTMFGFDFSGSWVNIVGGVAVGKTAFLAVIIKFGLCCPELVVMASLAIMLAVIMRHSAVAIGIGAALTFGGQIVAVLLTLLNYDFKKFILFLNTDLSIYYPTLNPVGGMMFEAPSSSLEGMSVAFSLIVLAVYFICFTYIALDSFNRRDIK